jgi:gliding motility-associated-like protein
LSNGCVDTAFVSLSNDTLITLLGFNNIDPSCGLNDGSVNVITTGATGPITYNWSGGTLAGTASTNPLSGLGAGLYTVTVTDSLTNCKASGSAVLTAAAAPVVSFSSVNNPSCNLSNGSITVSGTPGPFSYLWSDGQTTATAMGLASNLAYSCTVTYQGCTVAVPAVSLTNDALQIAIVDKDDIICNGDLSSYANIDILVGDSATTSFAWSNGATTQNIAGMSAGTYTVTATSGSCAVTQSITVVDVLLTINPWIVTAGQNSGTIQLNDMADIDGVLNTNHANAVFGWTQDVAGIVSIADSTLVATMVTGLESGDTWLYFTANAGPCTAMDSVLVTTEAYLGMPTAFSPNGDGINDLFQPAGLTGGSNKVTKFEIYNRWGQLLYSDNIAYSWDGNFNGVPQPVDVYIYVFEYTPDNGAPVEIRGEFTLIR